MIDYSDRNQVPITLKNNWRSLLVLFGSLLITGFLTWFTYRIVDKQYFDEFFSDSNQINLQIKNRLHAHALILRAGAAFFAVADTVTRSDWEEFNIHSKINLNLPGILGLGYSKVIPEESLEQHIEKIRNEGFPEYEVYPKGDRDIFTSIVYLEPFSGRNLRAFGYDMFSEPVRKKAMEFSRDYDVAMLSGKVALVQETGEDVQFGTLMYVPLYKKNQTVNTVEQRRTAIEGWVYSPYRMDDLMYGILGDLIVRENEGMNLKIYDDSISDQSLLYNSQKYRPVVQMGNSIRTLTLPVEFNGKKWVLFFTQVHDNLLFEGSVLIILTSGILISILLFLLSLSFFKISYRSEQIKLKNEELQQLNATKDKFFSIIAHDLKGPFHAITGFSEVLVQQLKNKNNEDVLKMAEIIKKSSGKAMDLLMNLLEWSQSQTGRMKFNPKQIDLVVLVNEVEQLFEELAKNKNIRITKSVPSRAPVFADQAMISTILRNLVSNAIKYSQKGGKVLITVKLNATGAIVSVSDKGVGIPKQHIDKIFRIDESYTTTGTENEKGTGLGLILCREFIEKHGGRIWVKSEEQTPSSKNQGGSTFSFSIPSGPSAN